MGLVTEGRVQLCRVSRGAVGFQGNVPDSQDPCLALLTPLGPVPHFGSTNRSETAKACSVRDVWVHTAACSASVLLGAISGLMQLFGEHVSLVKLGCLARAGSKHSVLGWQDWRPQEAVMRNSGPVT